MSCSPGEAAVCWVDADGELHGICLTPQPGRNVAAVFGSIAKQLAAGLGTTIDEVMEAAQGGLLNAELNERPTEKDGLAVYSIELSVLDKSRNPIRANIAIPVSVAGSAPA